MAVTVANIIIGACTSFKVDNVELGGTSGGVTVERKQKLVGISVDQVPGDVADAIDGDEITVKTILAEATLTNLQMAWGITAAPVVATGPARETLSLGIEKGLKAEHALVFVGPCPSGTYTTRTYTLGKAVSMVSGASFKHEKTKETLFPVEFKLHPDLAAAAGSEYGTIVDQ